MVESWIGSCFFCARSHVGILGWSTNFPCISCWSGPLPKVRSPVFHFWGKCVCEALLVCSKAQGHQWCQMLVRYWRNKVAIKSVPLIAPGCELHFEPSLSGWMLNSLYRRDGSTRIVILVMCLTQYGLVLRQISLETWKVMEWPNWWCSLFSRSFCAEVGYQIFNQWRFAIEPWWTSTSGGESRRRRKKCRRWWRKPCPRIC